MIKWNNGVSRRSLTVTAKKWTEKCEVRAELLVVLLKIPLLLRFIYSPGAKTKVKKQKKQKCQTFQILLQPQDFRPTS